MLWPCKSCFRAGEPRARAAASAEREARDRRLISGSGTHRNILLREATSLANKSTSVLAVGHSGITIEGIFGDESEVGRARETRSYMKILAASC